MRLYSEVLDKKRLVSNIVFSLIVFLSIAILYYINSYCVKPQIVESDSVFNYFMVNYFNDLWAGIFIVFSANLIVLITQKKYIKSVIFYVCLWILESFIWEIARPYVLTIFNPFNKTPKFLWGDIVIYGIGTLLGYLLFKVFNFKLRKKNRRNKKVLADD